MPFDEETEQNPLVEVAELLARGFLRLYGRGPAHEVRDVENINPLAGKPAHAPADPDQSTENTSENFLDLTRQRSVPRHGG